MEERLHNLVKRISIIIPVAPDDDTWIGLITDIISTSLYKEIILVGCKPEPYSFQAIRNKATHNSPLIWVYTEKGRAHQLNYGASIAEGDYLWFLHADSRFSLNTFPALCKSLQNYPLALHYFNLSFYDYSLLMKINAAGVWFRSHCLKMPFGDQGFFLSKNIFYDLQGFPTETSYGEDHLFIWLARRHKIRLQLVKAVLYTSARKYKINGWFKTTIQTFYLTWKQALPEIYHLLKARL